MSNVFIGVSGCSGGVQGPAGLYKYLKKMMNPDSQFIALPTIPDDLLSNIDKVQQEVLSQQKQGKRDIYLVGYSMGGAVVAISAQRLEQQQKGLLKGVILLSSQTEGLQALQALDVPVLAFHGEEDECFSVASIQKSIKKLSQKNKTSVILQGKHDLMPESKKSSSHVKNLAEKVLRETEEFFP